MTAKLKISCLLNIDSQLRSEGTDVWAEKTVLGNETDFRT